MTSRFRRPLGLVVAAALGFAAGTPGEAKAVSTVAPPDCATARARAEIDAVGAATYAWLMDILSALQAAEVPSAPLFEPVCPDSPPLDLTLVAPINYGILSIFLVPDYIAWVPPEDPWGHPYDYRLNVANPLSADVIAIRSAGSDGLFEGTTYDVRPTAGPADDLVFYNDSWVRDLPRLDPVSRQRTTTEQVTRLGADLLEWIIDNVSARPGAPTASHGWPPSTIDMADYTPISAEELSDLLTTPPWIYTRCVPRLDAWGTPYDYRLNDNLLGFYVASLRSLGSDALAEGDVYDWGTFPAEERYRDIIWADGCMARAPDESGQEIFLDGFESAELWGYWSCGPGF